MQGVSFHVRRTGIASPPQSHLLPQLDTRSGVGPHEIRSLRASAEQARPDNFSKMDIERLMADFARHEVHTLVLDAIDAAVRWKQLTDTLERHVSPGDETREFADDEIDALLAARTTLRLWRHRLQMLEMIADAQRSLITQARSHKK